ncbi:hypothetical protein [Streptodolium elevatio]
MWLRRTDVHSARSPADLADIVRRRLTKALDFDRGSHILHIPDESRLASVARAGVTSALLKDKSPQVDFGDGAAMEAVAGYADGIVRAVDRYASVAKGNVLPFHVQPHDGRGWPENAVLHTNVVQAVRRDGPDVDLANYGVAIQVSRRWASPEQHGILLQHGALDREGEHFARMGAHEVGHVLVANAHPEWMHGGVVPGYPNAMLDDLKEIVGGIIGKPPGKVELDDLAGELGSYATSLTGELAPSAVENVTIDTTAAHEGNEYISDRLEAAIPPFTPGPAAQLFQWRGRARTYAATGLGAAALEQASAIPAYVPETAQVEVAVASEIESVVTTPATHGLSAATGAVDGPLPSPDSVWRPEPAADSAQVAQLDNEQGGHGPELAAEP